MKGEFEKTGNLDHKQYTEEQRNHLIDLIAKMQKDGTGGRKTRKILRMDYNFYMSMTKDDQ